MYQTYCLLADILTTPGLLQDTLWNHKWNLIPTLGQLNTSPSTLRSWLRHLFHASSPLFRELRRWISSTMKNYVKLQFVIHTSPGRASFWGWILLLMAVRIYPGLLIIDNFCSYWRERAGKHLPTLWMTPLDYTNALSLFPLFLPCIPQSKHQMFQSSMQCQPTKQSEKKIENNILSFYSTYISK